MSKLLTIFLLVAASLALTPAARAECGFVQHDGTLTIVVGKGSQSCFSSDEFRSAFKAQITAALEGGSVSSGARQKKAFDERNGSSRKLWNIAERQHQIRAMNGSYFGQQR